MTREEKIEQIVCDAGTCYDYRDFAKDCVRQVVSQWTDKEIDEWFGGDEMEEEDEE